MVCQSVIRCLLVLNVCGSIVSLSPRFLLTSPTVYCVPFCPLSCIHGYEKAPSGCLLCKCDSPVRSTQSSLSAGSTPALPLYTRVYLLQPCNPAVRLCNIRCKYGYLTGPGGCRYCACATPVSVPMISLTVPTTSTPMPTSPPTPMPTSLPTSLPISLPTSAYISAVIPSYFDPCLPSQNTCNKDCNDQYVKGPGGCQYCFCASRLPVQTTQASLTSTIQPRIPTAWTLLGSHSEVCDIALTICQTKCPDGFITRDDNCMYCECDTHTDIPGFLVRLPKPCVAGADRCKTRCLSGYLTGPSSCQYCACNH